MVHGIRKTIGKLALAAATRSPTAAVRLLAHRLLVAFEESMPPHSGRTQIDRVAGLGWQI